MNRVRSLGEYYIVCYIVSFHMPVCYIIRHGMDRMAKGNINTEYSKDLFFRLENVLRVSYSTALHLVGTYYI